MGDNNDGHGYLRGDPRGDFRGGPMRLNGRIMITAMVCLFVVVVIVVLLHIYARCVLRRQARRRAALRQLGVPVGITTAQYNEPKRGLSQSVIASLPSFVYKNVDHMNNSTTTTTTGGNPIECSVCLCTLEDEEIARLLPNCKHTFHAECIDMWLHSHSTCPICRTEAEPSNQLQQQPAADQSVIELGQLGVPAAAVATTPSIEGTSSSSAKVGRTDSSSRLSSFRRMLSRERTDTTTTTRIHQTDNGVGDIERQ